MGVFQLKDGSWGYRVLVKDQDGISRNRRATRDAFGNKFKTKRAATAAMNAVVQQFSEPPVQREKKHSVVTVADVYEEYCENGRSDRAFATKRKQDSLWRIHLSADFGSKRIVDLTSAEVNDYLSNLYYGYGYAYKYVEGFLKMFYLIIGRAYSKEWLSIDRYAKLCVDKGTKIHMPKMKIDEDQDIKTFTMEQTDMLDAYFKGTNIETAYLLGRYCGLRAGETFGLTWNCVDFDNNVIIIDKQMQIQDGVIRIVAPKTRNAMRQVVMCTKLKEHLLALYKQRELDQVEYREVREQKEIRLVTHTGEVISSLDLVNTLWNGKTQTETVLRFHAKMIRKDLHLDFKYHYLRHTFGTRMALANVPQFLLCSQMGHGNINVTGKYYLGENKDSIEVLRRCVDSL